MRRARVTCGSPKPDVLLAVFSRAPERHLAGSSGGGQARSTLHLEPARTRFPFSVSADSLVRSGSPFHARARSRTPSTAASSSCARSRGAAEPTRLRVVAKRDRASASRQPIALRGASVSACTDEDVRRLLARPRPSTRKDHARWLAACAGERCIASDPEGRPGRAGSRRSVGTASWTTREARRRAGRRGERCGSRAEVEDVAAAPGGRRCRRSQLTGRGLNALLECMATGLSRRRNRRPR